MVLPMPHTSGQLNDIPGAYSNHSQTQAVAHSSAEINMSF